MKKIFTLFAAVALTASAAMADVITLDLNKPMNPTSMEYNEYGIWTGCYDDVNYTWLEFGDENGEFMLSHLIDGEGASWGGYYWDGFCPAIGGDQTDYNGAYTNTYGGCMAGGGCVIGEDGTVSADPAQPYLVAYYSSWAMEGPSNQVTFVDKDGNTTFKPVGVYVCNHPYPYYGCVHGDGFAREFDEEGDYFQLTAVGVDAEGNEKSVSINLVEFTNGQLIALNDWTFFDLSSLGEVESVYFTLSSTDNGAYGMNTAAYFCMDKFQVYRAPEAVTVTGNVKDSEGNAIEGVNITLTVNAPSTDGKREANTYNAITDANGVYTMDVVPVEDATYTMTFEKDGYVTKTLENVDIENVPEVVLEEDDNTAISSINASSVVSVQYIDAMGRVSERPFQGMNIVVKTHTDGTHSTSKVIR